MKPGKDGPRSGADLYQDSLKAWLDGELDSARAREVERHVAACSGCQAEAADFRAVSSRLRAAGAAPAPDADVVLARARRLQSEERQLVFSLKLLSAAAALVLGISLGLAIWSSSGLNGGASPGSDAQLDRANALALVLGQSNSEGEF
jgi:anti-sigma factor RsiW